VQKRQSGSFAGQYPLPLPHTIHIAVLDFLICGPADYVKPLIVLTKERPAIVRISNACSERLVYWNGLKKKRRRLMSTGRCSPLTEIMRQLREKLPYQPVRT